MLPAAIRTPWLPLGKSNREQPQVASPPGAAPNPCKRSSRMAPFASNRPASRAICRRCWSAGRSEEHTSELQSRLHLVCRLLLEKKKNAPVLYVTRVTYLPNDEPLAADTGVSRADRY